MFTFIASRIQKVFILTVTKLSTYSTTNIDNNEFSTRNNYQTLLKMNIQYIGRAV